MSNPYDCSVCHNEGYDHEKDCPYHPDNLAVQAEQEPEIETDPFIVDLLNQALASETGPVFATREWEEEEEEKPKEPKVGYPLTGDTTHPKPPPEGPAAGAT